MFLSYSHTHTHTQEVRERDREREREKEEKENKDFVGGSKNVGREGLGVPKGPEKGDW